MTFLKAAAHEGWSVIFHATAALVCAVGGIFSSRYRYDALEHIYELFFDQGV